MIFDFLPKEAQQGNYFPVEYKGTTYNIPFSILDDSIGSIDFKFDDKKLAETIIKIIFAKVEEKTRWRNYAYVPMTIHTIEKDDSIIIRVWFRNCDMVDYYCKSML